MSTRPCVIVLIAVLLQASVPTLAQPAPRAGRPLLLIDRDTIASHSRSTRSEIATQTTRATPGRATEDNGPGAQLAEIVASVQALLVRTKRLLLETSVLCLRLLARLSRFQTL